MQTWSGKSPKVFTVTVNITYLKFPSNPQGANESKSNLCATLFSNDVCTISRLPARYHMLISFSGSLQQVLII